MKYLIIISAVLVYVAGSMFYKAGEWLFNFCVYISTDLDVDHKRINRQINVFGVQRYLLDKFNQAGKGVPFLLNR